MGEDCEDRAADLSDGSVVDTADRTWIRQPQPDTWRCTDGSITGDWQIDDVLTQGAQVLRVGSGTG